MMKKVITSLATFMAVSLMSLATHSVSAAEQLNVSGSNLQLNGLAVHSELRKEWFLSGLYLTSKSSDPSAISTDFNTKRMQLKVLADNLSGRRLKRFWIERIKNNNEASEVLLRAKDVRAFANFMDQNLEASDVIDIDFVPSVGTIIYINGSEIGRVGEDLYPLVLNTWIGPRPPTTEFKDAILGNQPAVQYSDLLAKFSAINPTASRVAVFDQAAIAAKEEEERKQKEEEERLAEEERKATEAKKLAEQQKLANEKAAEQRLLAQQQAEDERKKLQEEAQTETSTPVDVVQQPIVEQVPAGPTAAELEAIRDQYVRTIRSHYAPFFEYPQREIIRKYARGKPLKVKEGKTHGDVSIALEVDKDGELVGGSLTQSSGEKILDDAVMSALFDAVPYPAMPADLPEETFKVTLSISIPAPQM